MAPREWCTSGVYSAGIVIGQTGQNVMLPLFADTVSASGGTPYFVVWFTTLAVAVLFGLLVLLLHLFTNDVRGSNALMLSREAQVGPLQVGLANALNGMMVVFASPSSRTAPYLQAILGNFIIPLTVCMRTVMLREMPSTRQLVATALVCCGVYVSVLPTIRQWHGPDTRTHVGSILWPTVFAVGFATAAFMLVLEEQALGQTRAHALVFVFWLNFWQFVFVCSLFWLDEVPGYGMSGGMGTWAEHMGRGLCCVSIGGPCGAQGFGWGAAFVLCYMLAYMASALLLKTSSAVWQTIVAGLVGPLGILWWTVFQGKPRFHWHPEWAATTTFAILGLAVMTPGMVMYNWEPNAGHPEARQYHLLGKECS